MTYFRQADVLLSATRQGQGLADIVYAPSRQICKVLRPTLACKASQWEHVGVAKGEWMLLSPHSEGLCEVNQNPFQLQGFPSPPLQH